MALRVNIIESGVNIEHEYKKQSITLDGNAWEKLVECSDEVVQATKDKANRDWVLQPEKNIRINTSIFNNAVYIHIREWNEGYPTRNGISFFEKAWKDLSMHFVHPAEMKLGKKVMTTMMRLEAKSQMPKACEGCVSAYPSQRDHDCLMQPEILALNVMDKIDIKPQPFILMLAQEAVKEDIVLERPYETFKLVKFTHLEAIKDAVVAADYNF